MLNNRLYFTSPASHWEESFLLGNGSIGLSVWGGIGNERIQLNHDSFWAGTGRYTEPELDSESLADIRSFISEGHYLIAEERLKTALTGPFTSPYQPMGELLFDYGDPRSRQQTLSYERMLDLSKSLYTQAYRDNTGLYKTEGFTSHPDTMAAIRFSASDDGKYTGRITYSSPYESYDEIPEAEFKDGIWSITIRAPFEYDGFLDKSAPKFSRDNGIVGRIRISIVLDDGSCTFKDGGLDISDATEIVLFIRTEAEGPAAGRNTPRVFGEAITVPYDKIRANHQEDYRALYSKVGLSLGTEQAAANKDLGSRLQTAQTIEDPGLIELLFNYGRYLLISSSRPGGLPANLQGIWNPHVSPPWWSNYTLNINTQMNYWGAGPADLSECTEPLFDFMMRLMENGRITAKRNYGCRGWCAHHQSDIWAGCNVRGRSSQGIEEESAQYSLWPFGGVWLALMSWEHYEYTQDKVFLEQKVRPLLEGCVDFLRDFMVEDREGGLTTSPSTSPENRFVLNGASPAVSDGSTMDLSLSLEMVQAYLKMGKLIQCRDDLSQWCQDAAQRIHPYRIGGLSQLQEWSGDWDREEDKHRHVSHLVSLFPGDFLMRGDMSDYRLAAESSLTMRGMDATGWSTVWKIALMARLGKPEQVSELISKLLTPVSPGNEDVHFTGSGVYPNLMCAHPPFQIDGNLGIVAAVSEILFRYTHSTLTILPALPESWHTGSFDKLRCRAGFLLSVEWKDNKLVSVNITATRPGEMLMVYGERSRSVSYRPGEILWFDENLIERRQ